MVIKNLNQIPRYSIVEVSYGNTKYIVVTQTMLHNQFLGYF